MKSKMMFNHRLNKGPQAMEYVRSHGMLRVAHASALPFANKTAR